MNIEVQKKFYEDINRKGTDYIDSVLIPMLIAIDYKLDVLDLYWFDNDLRSLGSL